MPFYFFHKCCKGNFFRQVDYNMEMVIISTYFYWITFEFFAKSDQIIMELFFNGRNYEGFSAFRAENNMEVILDESLCHSNGFNIAKIDQPG